MRMRVILRGVLGSGAWLWLRISHFASGQRPPETGKRSGPNHTSPIGELPLALRSRPLAWRIQQVLDFEPSDVAKMVICASSTSRTCAISLREMVPSANADSLFGQESWPDVCIIDIDLHELAWRVHEEVFAASELKL